jgi:serine/threonine protein kinase
MSSNENQGPTPIEFCEGQRVGAGRFTLIRVLGRGGMGVVWLARDRQLGENVALKMLPAEIRSDPVALDDLRRETLKSRKLTHPNIVRIHDLSHVEGESAFISMEYVNGPNFFALRSKQPSHLFSWEYLKPLVRQLCDALEYAHGEKVIHRDLKPGNLMLDSRGRLKLADFGIAATASDSASRMSSRHITSGTPSYMSPQQMDGQMPRPADDIYALGATLCELLTSRPPFHSGDIAHQVKHLPAPRMSARLAELGLTNEIPEHVEALVMACLAKVPEARPENMRAIAEGLGFGSEIGPGPCSPVSEPPDASRTQKSAIRSFAWLGLLLIGAIGAVIYASHKSRITTPTAADSKAATPGTPTSFASPGKDQIDPAMQRLLDSDTPWLGEITLAPGHYHPSKKIVVGAVGSKGSEQKSGVGTVISPPKIGFESADLAISNGTWMSDTNSFRDTLISVQMHGRFSARNSIFDRCTLQKAGGWFVDLFTSHWVFTNCVFSGRFFNSWEIKNVGAQIRNCTFYDVNLPSIVYRHDAGKEVLDPWVTIANCRFVHCRVPESIAIATRECLFESCTFGPPEPRLVIKTPITATLYIVDTNSLPKGGPNRTIEVRDPGRLSSPAGATLGHHRVGSNYEFEPDGAK